MTPVHETLETFHSFDMPGTSVECGGRRSLSSAKLLTGFVSLLIVSLASSRAVQSVSLAWDSNSESNIVGYVLRYGTTKGKPTQSLDVGKKTSATVSGLADGTTYFFTVTARNTFGLESPPSDEVSHTTLPLGAHKLMVINGTGSGSYMKGDRILLKANQAPSGQKFDRWTGDYQILDDPFSPTTTALMLFRDLTVQAAHRSTNQVAVLSFNEGQGTVVEDGSGSAHIGTLVNGPTWTAGKHGFGISFNGNTDYVSVANPNTLNFGTSDFTIALWIKRQSTGKEHTILSKTANTSWTTGGKEFFISGSNSRLSFGCFGVGEVSSTGVITNDGLWHHVAVTFTDSSNTMAFYIDGAASGSGTLNLSADVGNHVVKIGGHPAGHYFRGLFDELHIFSQALSSAEVRSITTTVNVPSAPTTAGPPPATTPSDQVAALSLNEGSGRTAADGSGPGHNGTLMNGATWTAGKFGNAVSLDGTNDYLSVANPNSLNFGTSDFTIALWIKRQATGKEHAIFSKTASGSWTRGGKELFINGSNNRVSFGCFGVGEASSTGTITNDGLWHHIAVTFTDSTDTITVYIDGAERGGGTLDLPPDASDHAVKIGGHPAGHYFRGQVDELRIFKRALSSSEVGNIMNSAIASGEL